MAELVQSGKAQVLPLLDNIPDLDLRREAVKSLSLDANMHQMVKVFHRMYGLPIVKPESARADFAHITRERLAMRFGLIVEEFMELCEAMDIRADINFLYQDEDGAYTQSRSIPEMEAYERLQKGLVPDTEQIGLLQDGAGNYLPILDHDSIKDDELHAIVRQRLQTAIEETEERNMVEVADACFDLKYVIIGFELEVGIPSQAVALEGQASNLSKLGEDGNPIYREDGKVLKGPFFFKPRVELALRSWGMKLGRVFGK